MSAPTTTRLPYKNVYNFTLRCVFLQAFVLFCVLIFPLEYTNLVSNCLLSCKLITAYLCISSVYFAIQLPSSSATATTSSLLHKVRNGMKALGLYIVSILMFHVVAVLYGASFYESVAETFHFSMIISSTAVLPPLSVLGVNFSSWVRVFAQNRPELGPETVAFVTSIMSVVGAWLGAFPIPLDWDRPWQVWPITCVVGSIVGHVVGLTSGALYLIYSYRQLKKHKVT